MSNQLNEFKQQFSQVNGFENKYMLLLKLAKTGEFLEPELCVDENEIAGCEAKVWMCSSMVDGKVHFKANSDSRLIRAILWIVVSLANDSDQAENIDYVSILLGFGLGNVVSQSRQNGIMKIQESIEMILI
ncbi:SufE family protein [Marinicellulosiphila megalodicopiae]|uniref:SufE family protein n=1 Tax=Marinicellulosiphila megalodicopiae TaxID=2724896 RepID=UPI003BB10497